jgi:hypothetical protein
MPPSHGLSTPSMPSWSRTPDDVPSAIAAELEAGRRVARGRLGLGLGLGLGS